MPNLLPRETAHSLALSVRETCKLSGLGRTTVYELIGSNKLPARKCGRRTIILLDELQQALKDLPRAGSAS